MRAAAPPSALWRWLTGLAGALGIGFGLYHLRSILPPFLLAWLIAFLMDPLLDQLQRRGYSRAGAIALVYLLFFLVFLLVLLLLIPLLVGQVASFVAHFNEYVQEVSRVLEQWSLALLQRLETVEFPSLLKGLEKEIERWKSLLVGPPPPGKGIEPLPHEPWSLVSQWLVERLQHFSRWLLGFLSRSLWVLVLPFVAYYFLRDYDLMRWYFYALIPERWRQQAQGIGGELGRVLGGYLRAQALMCLSMATLATLGLALFHLWTGMQYYLFLGLLTGLFYLIPYIGIPSAAILTGLTAFLTGGHSWSVAFLAAGYILLLNLLSDYILAPKLMAEHVGLHPLMVIFALMAAGKVGGILGMVLATPIAASLKVLFVHLYPQARQAALFAAQRLQEDVAQKRRASEAPPPPAEETPVTEASPSRPRRRRRRR